MILHLIDAGGEHAGMSYRVIRQELAAYGNGLAEKAEIVALSKTDTVDMETIAKQLDRLKRAMRTYGPELQPGDKRQAPMLLSAATNQGVTDVLRALVSVIGTAKAVEVAREKAHVWQP